jgi:hypothetical protein
MQAVRHRKKQEKRCFSLADRFKACSTLAQKSSTQSANGPIHPKKLGKIMHSQPIASERCRLNQTIALVCNSM